MRGMWESWRLDAPTWAFIVWWVWFLGWESWALFNDSYAHTWTAHLRPAFVGHPLAWWLGIGFYAWFGVHIFAPPLEAAIYRAIAP